ncbi:hypothetical protein ACFQ07_02530 [Actinomadura adrarensis]|uniref:Uncharacterized protein n=1 Tax=Actinomadura adrarensis TaxID=1819600 RepID=A0ABW3CAX8_9ACTN
MKRIGRSPSTGRQRELRAGSLHEEVRTLVIGYKDRLARFGFESLEHVAGKNDCTNLVANQALLCPQEEMVSDLRARAHLLVSPVRAAQVREEAQGRPCCDLGGGR